MTVSRESQFRHSLAGFGVSLLFAACAGSSTAPKPTEHLPRALTAAEQLLVTQSNDFAFSLFRQVAQQAPDSNIFLSPLSASMALGMTMNGASGSTLDAMRTTLGFSTMSLGDIDASYESLIALLRGLDPSVDFRIANSIWYRQGFPFEQSFLDTTRKYFDATVQGLDFTDPAAVSTINAWVNTSTNGKIDQIVDAIDPNMVMYLINAMYFKGTWQYQFDPALTSSQPFTLADGSAESVQMMAASDLTLLATSTADYQAAELPYGGGAYVMDVVVPNAGKTLDDVVASFDGAAWRALLGSLTEQTGDVYIPRVTLSWNASLNDPLTALGMGIAFAPGAADFSGMSKARGRELFIGAVRQKTWVDVNEQGTEAAAATSVGAGLTSVTPPLLLRADRPFLFAIRERLSGTILFIGKMVKPPEGQ